MTIFNNPYKHTLLLSMPPNCLSFIIKITTYADENYECNDSFCLCLLNISTHKKKNCRLRLATRISKKIPLRIFRNTLRMFSVAGGLCCMSGNGANSSPWTPFRPDFSRTSEKNEGMLKIGSTSKNVRSPSS